ncbi:MAG: SHOCT domain-containing protein [Methylovulum sp.]|uniref:SHOCT domain-containing protein n=1 Tax=Methylovulum sp. TaxID=1916980 RepID=UPI002637C898|nr:SHOCT domain-containing protein [Methylovulum sp.]MDD2724342.1 SHOCT domain-containing protein [Methylovulum sp.]MDD5124938.1 SHOCT domain-containing protein [Methylovulum sp.]
MELLVIIFLIIFVIYSLQSSEKFKLHMDTLNAEYQAKYKEFEDTFQKASDFNPTFLYVGLDRKTGIAIDEPRTKVCIVKRNGNLLVHRVISYEDILSSELYKDGEIILKTVRSSQISGAVVGGLLLGGVGTVIGGLSGNKIQKNNTQTIILRVVVNDPTDPLLDVYFLNYEIDNNSEYYKLLLEDARQWQARMDILIKRAEREDAALRRNETSSVSLPDELRKLAELKNNGVLTDEEFNTLKEKILNQ